MKTNRIQLSSVLVRISSLLFLMILFIRCSGPTGPMGPQGQDGINYTHSAIYDVFSNDWSGNADGYRVSINVPEITDNIYYDGAVLVYRLVEIDPKSFNLLPYTYVDNALTIYLDYDAYIGSIDLIYKEVYNGVNDTPAITYDMAFKVVIIEGIPLTALKSRVNINDFAAVSKFLNIDKGLSTKQ
jgi:hypothetical protein